MGGRRKRKKFGTQLTGQSLLMNLFRLGPKELHKRFMAYTATFDPCELIRSHAIEGVRPREGRLTNFLGTVIDTAYLGDTLHGRAGEVEGVPIPANWHACVAEWGACLRALELAQKTFTVVELGCGWGCWLNNMAVAARNIGMQYALVGVEGDPDHLAFARIMFQENGIPEQNVTLHTGIAAAMEGVALFPRQRQKGSSWGLKPVFGATECQRVRAVQSGGHDELPMLSLARVVESLPRVDLLHIDIQGGEADLLDGSLPVITEKVAYMFVATHSRNIEKAIHKMMPSDGWIPEIIRPAIYQTRLTGPRLKIDGVMGWRNTRLLPL